MIRQLPKIILLQLNICGHLDSSKILTIIIAAEQPTTSCNCTNQQTICFCSKRFYE